MTKEKRIGTNLTEGPIMRTLLAFAIPIVLANLVQQLYSMVDLVIIGQFVGNVGTVGVNTGGEIADMLAVVGMGFSTAGQIYIAQLFGSKATDRIRQTMGTLISFMILLAIVLAAATILFSNWILDALNCPAEAMSEARRYMIITALAFPAVLGYNAMCGILRGLGESKRPLYFILIAAAINIVLDLILVAIFKLDAAGTAIATAVSQFGSFAASFIFLYRHRERFGIEFKLTYFKIDRHILVILLRLGLPQVARSLLVRLSMLWVNSTANAYGMVVSATNSVGNKLQKFLEVFISGVDTASASMIAQNLGAKKVERAGKVTINTLFATLVCAAVIGAMCAVIPQHIFGLFSPDPEVQELGALFLRIMIIHFFASATVGAYQAMVTGCGFVSLGFAIGILDGVICKVGLSCLFVYVFDMGYVGLFWGVALSRILPAILCACYYYSGRWKTRKLLSDK